MLWFSKDNKLKIYICKCKTCGTISTSEVAMSECECCGSDNIQISSRTIMVLGNSWYCRLWRFIKKNISRAFSNFRVSLKLKTR